eukprot:6763481-Pyramimonas_sp.AAC.1
MTGGLRDEVCPLLFDLVVDVGPDAVPKECAAVFQSSKQLDRFMTNRSVLTMATLESFSTG